MTTPAAAPRTFRQELTPTLRLAIPVILGELGWMTMGIVDTLMVGRLGPEAIGAVGVGSSLFVAVMIFGMGLFLGLDTLASQAFGGGRIEDCHRWLLHGVYLALALALPLTLVATLLVIRLDLWRIHPDVLRLQAPYMTIINVSVLPLLFYSAFRRYLQAIAFVRPIVVALVTANVLNLVGNWVLIYGKWGAPALGVEGSAWATVVARFGMAAILGGAIVYHEARHRTGLWRTSPAIEWARMRTLVRLGLPAAMQMTLEVGVFAFAGALAGRLDPISLAAHQISLNLAGFTFMVPLGMASAAAVRVGHAVGRGDSAGARVAGWTAIALSIAFMTVAAAAFVAIPAPLIRLFTIDPSVISLGVTLLLLAAVFQLFDGVQGVTTGVLRGVGDTRTPMFVNFAGHWLFGLPLGYVLCFRQQWGVAGLWIGLSAGLIVVAIALLLAWRRRAAALASGAVRVYA